MKDLEDCPYRGDNSTFLSKIKKLKTATVYTYASLGGVGDRGRVAISRLADRGIIVKAGRGRFFKPPKSVYKNSEKTVRLDKSMFSYDLFWSVGDGAEVKVDTLIGKYIESPRFKDVAALYHLFGYRRVLTKALTQFGSRKDERYTRVREKLEQCALRSIDDK